MLPLSDDRENGAAQLFPLLLPPNPFPVTRATIYFLKTLYNMSCLKRLIYNMCNMQNILDCLLNGEMHLVGVMFLCLKGSEGYFAL